MTLVCSRVLQRLVAILGAAGVLGLGLLPSEHVHVTRTPDGHHSDVIHRHFESHHPIETEASIGHGDDDVHWLESSFTSPTPPPHAYPVTQLLNERLQAPPPQPAYEWTIRAVRVSVHDPPWMSASGLRAPPSLSA